MEDKEQLISELSLEASEEKLKQQPAAKVPWYFANGFLLFWGLLFFAVVIPLFYRLPTANTMEDAKKNVFIAERAYANLYTLSNLGNKMVGSKINEVDAVNFLLKELELIKANSLKDYFDIEIDLSKATGSFPYKTSASYYQGVQNIAVKFSFKNSTSDSYLLVNTHFDSKPATPSAGDAGFMVAVMLEVLRVMSTTRQGFEHPIVFLFNGAEEIAMQAAHGFITQHKWAKNCKALVNVEGGGSGGREVLFQTGPNHPWLVKYYKQNAKHPFATTLAEELFQTGIIPSDSDFTIFKKYMPGLDMTQIINGYVYHTKYDVIDIIPRESFQNSGDNILNIVRGLSNATELRDIGAHKGEHSIFFDVLGLYFIHYSVANATNLNFAVAVATFLLVFVSMWRMAAKSEVSTSYVARWFILLLVLQLVSFVLGLAFPVVVAYVFDMFGLSLTYFSTPWLLICLYVCPSLLGLCLPITIYFYFQRGGKINCAYHLQLSLHAQAIIVALLMGGLTYLRFRSAYALMIPLLFYILALAFNLLTTLHDRGYAWSGVLKFIQIIPFLYSSYLIYTFVAVLLPMQGRFFNESNPDLLIAGLVAVGTVLSLGFVIPLINTFRRPSTVILTLFAISAVGMYLASSTQIGFPYRPKTSGQRVSYLQVRNKFYEYDGTLSKDESGYLFNLLDRRGERPWMGTRVNLTGLQSMKTRCNEHMMCGMPLFDYRYITHQEACKFLPRDKPIEPPGEVTLTLLNKTLTTATTMRYYFNLTGPHQMSIFVKPYEDVRLSNWSFSLDYLEKPPAKGYHVWINVGIVDPTVIFYLDITKSNGDFNVPCYEFGASGHWIQNEGDELSQKFAASFPSYSILAQWPSFYQRYIF
ncbi:endoplasmic reticulum metallopeptidase 1-like [Drosophila busckii]|uniref:endoplasmic reticulum metallopeptidase 1-like n=1 Tax=Drosophila busckii TaxID=30019 RepID=UPI00083EB94A|nr:endoplasmic reticulum metallopeptidase 1-like [Drosophila busckii]